MATGHENPDSQMMNTIGEGVPVESAAEGRLTKIFRYILSCLLIFGCVLAIPFAGMASNNVEERTYTWHTDQSFAITRAPSGNPLLRPYVVSECLSEIIVRLHKIVPWNKVKKRLTQKKIWALYTKGKKTSFKINGFSVGDLHRSPRGVHATCNFEAVTPKIDISEETILRSTGLAKYF